mgnify:FL=1
MCPYVLDLHLQHVSHMFYDYDPLFQYYDALQILLEQTTYIALSKPTYSNGRPLFLLTCEPWIQK